MSPEAIIAECLAKRRTPQTDEEYYANEERLHQAYVAQYEARQLA